MPTTYEELEQNARGKIGMFFLFQGKKRTPQGTTLEATKKKKRGEKHCLRLLFF